MHAIMIAPAVCIAGVIFSLIMDRKVKGTYKNVLSYLVGGFILGIIYYFMFDFNIIIEGIILFGVLGALNALWFLAVQTVSEPFLNKIKLY